MSDDSVSRSEFDPDSPTSDEQPLEERNRAAQPVDDEQPPRLPFPVVGIGASAGGIEAFSEFFDAMPANSGMAFVLIQHLPPDRHSLVADILSKHTKMPVEQVQNGMAVKANHVYVIRPGHTLTIKNGALHLGDELGRPKHGRPVDDFFKSLAEEQRERAICVILSGMGSNGSAGAQAIKAVGGICIAQDTETALFPSMPRHLIESGYADYILRIADIPEVLIGYSKHSYATERPDAARILRREQQQMREILAILRTRTRQDFSGYRKPTILRRVQRRMGLNGASKLGEYAKLLRQNVAEVSALADDLLIHVTGFFRDADAWEALRRHAIVPLVASRESGEPLRCWVTACSSGEEAYSLAILLVEECERVNKSLDIKIFSTDTAERTLANARNGLFPGGIEADIPPERLDRFFQKEDAVYRVRQDLREKVVFAPQNVLQDPPFSRLDIVTCRNLLIYLEPEMQQRVLNLLHFGLREGGTLFLGTSETVPTGEQMFEVIDKKARIFRRIGSTRHGVVEFPLPRPSAFLSPNGPEVRGTNTKPSIPHLTTKALLARHVPAAITIDRDFRIVYFHGNTQPYLSQPSGEPSRDLFVLATEMVRGSLRTAVHRSMAENSVCSVQNGSIQTPMGRTRVIVTVSPLEMGEKSEFFVVSFDERIEIDLPEGQARNTNQEMQAELQRVRDELQTTIEELQTSNEEHKASSEEVMSINEELQSTNEELETSKEEMQSLNEELTTVNSQLQAKMEEYQTLSSDLGSLLSSTDIAVIFLDTRFRIRRFTPAATKLLELISTDVGRPLNDLAKKFADPNLLTDAKRVLENLVPVQREISTDTGQWYLRRLLPYRTTDNRIDGVVITFMETTETKMTEAALRLSENNLADELGLMNKLHAVTRRLHGIPALKDAPKTILTAAMELLNADMGHLQLIDTASDSPCVAQQGFDPALAREYLSLIERADFDTPHSRARLKAESVIVTDLSKDSTYHVLREPAVVAGVSAVHCFPLLRREDRCIGVLCMHYRKPYAPSERMLRATDLFAKHAADLIDRMNSEEQLVTLLHKEQTSRQLLDDAAHMKDQFLAALSHELRTPLSAILLWAKALRDIKVAPEQVEAGLNAIVRNAEAQSRLIEDLMDTSRIVTGKLRLEIGEVDLAKVIEAAVQSVEPGIRAKHLQITKTLDPGLGVVRADPERLQQVLWNLLSNALKFTEKGGITLTVRRNGKDVEIIVSDTGTGIDGEFLPFVFERFRQKDGSVSKKSMGLGLGLAITKQLVELHGGAIRVTSGGLNKGATFTVRIPMPAVRGSAPVKSAALALETKPLLGAKILLIEDDAASREIMELLLRQAGADVVAVGTAASAMEEFARSRPTLLISDIGLPEIDGYSLLENIRALEARGQSSPVPAIAMTAHAREEHRARAIEVGYNTHFSKPVDIERLISILADFVRDATQSGNDKHGKN